MQVKVLLFKYGSYLVISIPVQDEKAFIAGVKCWKRDVEEGGGAKSGEMFNFK